MERDEHILPLEPISPLPKPKIYLASLAVSFLTGLKLFSKISPSEQTSPSPVELQLLEQLAVEEANCLKTLEAKVGESDFRNPHLSHHHYEFTAITPDKSALVKIPISLKNKESGQSEIRITLVKDGKNGKSWQTLYFNSADSGFHYFTGSFSQDRARQDHRKIMDPAVKLAIAEEIAQLLPISVLRKNTEGGRSPMKSLLQEGKIVPAKRVTI